MVRKTSISKKIRAHANNWRDTPSAEAACRVVELGEEAKIIFLKTYIGYALSLNGLSNMTATTNLCLDH